jgi:hypothetical protein
MIQQGILPFKLEHTEELITPRSGLALFAEVVRTLRVDQTVRESFARPGSNRGYEAWSYIEPLLLMLEGGGRHVEDLREIRDDETLRRLIDLWRMPSLSTFGDWMVRSGATGGGLGFSITADQDAAVKEVIKTVRDWKPHLTAEGERTRRTASAIMSSPATGMSWRRKRWSGFTISGGKWRTSSAGRLVRHGRRLILRLATSLEKYRLFLEIRRLCATFH